MTDKAENASSAKPAKEPRWNAWAVQYTLSCLARWKDRFRHLGAHDELSRVDCIKDIIEADFQSAPSSTRDTDDAANWRDAVRLGIVSDTTLAFARSGETKRTLQAEPFEGSFGNVIAKGATVKDWCEVHALVASAEPTLNDGTPITARLLNEYRAIMKRYAYGSDSGQAIADLLADLAIASLSSATGRKIELEEGYTYWTHEGYVIRVKQDERAVTELLGPGGWTPAL